MNGRTRLSERSAYEAAADIAAEVAAQRVRATCHRLGANIGHLRLVPSVTDFVFRGTLGGDPVIAKCTLLGMSRATLKRHVVAERLDIRGLTAAAEGWAVAGGQAVDAVGTALLADVLVDGPVRVPRIYGADRDVLVIEHVEGARPLGSLGTTELSDSLASLWEAVTRIWRATAISCAVPGELNVAHRRSITATFARKVGSTDLRHYVASRVDDTSLAELLTVLGNMLRLVLATPASAPRLVFGDLKPEHVLVHSAGLVLIDNAVHINEPAQDVARFLLRAALTGSGHLLETQPAWNGFVSLPHVARLMALDWFNIATTWCAASDAEPAYRLPLKEITTSMMDAALSSVDGPTAADRVCSLVPGSR